MATPHNHAEPGMIADKILLPGDPLRAKYIAETFLEDAVCFNTVRGMLGFTGTYKGKRVSVMGTGMGQPSLHIYVSELIMFYGVKRLVRVGTCGSFSEDLHTRDVLIASGATTDNGMNASRFGNIRYSPIASFNLVHDLYHAAEELGIKPQVGNVFSSDQFYDDNGDEKHELLRKYGVKVVEMESAELFTLAARHGVEAGCILTVSDNILTHEETTPEERQTTFENMMKVALEAI